MIFSIHCVPDRLVCSSTLRAVCKYAFLLRWTLNQGSALLTLVALQPNTGVVIA